MVPDLVSGGRTYDASEETSGAGTGRGNDRYHAARLCRGGGRRGRDRCARCGGSRGGCARGRRRRLYPRAAAGRSARSRPGRGDRDCRRRSGPRESGAAGAGQGHGV